MKAYTLRNVLIFLLAFLSIGAIGGGAVLIISPSGKLMGMPLSVLEKSPFNSFLIPGLVLFMVLGITPFFLTIALIKKPACILAEKFNAFSDMHWSWAFSIYIAFALIGWVQIQIIFLQAVHWLHTFYVFYGIAIIFVALLPKVRSCYENHPVKLKDKTS